VIEIGTSIGLKPAFEVLAPQFERTSGYKLKFTFATATPLKRRMDAGETFDIVILMPQLIEELINQGKVVAGTQRIVGKSCIGMAIRKGALKPDISTPQALRNTLLNAKSVAYSKEGQAGPMMAQLIEGLGIASQLNPKTIRETRSAGVALNVVEGKADIAFTVICEILPVPGAELAGTLPAELNRFVHFAAGIGVSTTQRQASEAFLDFLQSPSARPAFAANGIDPE
jgi:molybdate transport system substrate-binding protein